MNTLLINMKTLNVKQTNNAEISHQWGMNTRFLGQLFIRCNAKGVINWEKAPVYSLGELLKRGGVKIIDDVDANIVTIEISAIRKSVKIIEENTKPIDLFGGPG